MAKVDFRENYGEWGGGRQRQTRRASRGVKGWGGIRRRGGGTVFARRHCKTWLKVAKEEEEEKEKKEKKEEEEEEEEEKEKEKEEEDWWKVQ
ncbi:hypothetical protein E2C01_065462 [Portunus trituberculatus]|uniref:Uncharacterized protein n=1 Tax=Portunus trituberculatus TaxID=210409 RepID=A0A5B7HFN4_PORTR|nr:hypothetical protein [Portunus trituberculatus]